MGDVININSHPLPIHLDSRKEKIEERTKAILEEYERLKLMYDLKTAKIHNKRHQHNKKEK